MDINFVQSGSFSGPNGQNVLNNPTSIQFGPDSRLYVAEQDGTINALTVELQNGEFVATANEVLELPGGGGVVQSIQNHNDDGSLSDVSNRQVTGLVVAGTAEDPVLYISSSDPRISFNEDSNLDTNSGIVTRVTRNGDEWEAVDIIRGLPRSEENHSVNGLQLSPDGSTLFLAVGGNTNNGAPSDFFSFTSEFALSGTVLEIDLDDINSRPILTDADGGQGGVARSFVYDLPTLDDPTVANDGVREDSNGLDVAGPFGGNDGFNQAILPADAPLRIFADGLRNPFDLVLTESGQLFTVDNGSNSNLGGDPIFVDGQPTDQVNNGGTGGPEPLFLLEDGGFFGHPNPTRSNQDLAFTVFNDEGLPDTTLPINTVPNLAELVPDGVDIQPGFIIDPSQFTGDPTRLAESGVRVPRSSAESNALLTISSSSNGLVEFTDDAFGGALTGDLLVAQFNGNITRLDLSPDGTAATSEALVTGLDLPLDVTVGPNGSIFVAEFGANAITVFTPEESPSPAPTPAPVPAGEGTVLFRVNAGGPEIAALDGGPNFLADTTGNNSAFLIDPGSNSTATFVNVAPGSTVDTTIPGTIFDTERFDFAGGSELQYAFDVPEAGLYEVRLFVGNGFSGTAQPEERLFDVAIEGNVPSNLNNIDLISLFGNEVGGVLSSTVNVTDGTLNLEFLHEVENPLINGIEIIQLEGSASPAPTPTPAPQPSPSPAPPTEAEAILLALGSDEVDADNNDGQGYAADAVGSATLSILAGNNNVRASNFGNSSFQLTNTGDKQIAGVVIDLRTAVFNDSVIDFDGSAGDTVARPFEADSPGETGIVVESGNLLPADHLLFPGSEPLPNTTGTGIAAVTGGHRGLLLRFDGSSGGFQAGETVGFAGDVDPNSIAGLERLGVNGVDTGTLGSPAGSTFDIGGISGAELIGSSFTVLFDDGTTATGFLHSDGSQAGSIGEAVAGRPQQTATLTIDTGDEVAGAGVFSSGDNGIYGGDPPVITVNGPAGATVRVVLQKGVNPATNDSNGIAQLVADRLATTQPDFQVNNAFDVQTLDVVIGSDGTATLPGDAFEFSTPTSGITFAGDDVQPLAFTAAVISQGSLAEEVALGPVSQPLILTNPSELPIGAPSPSPTPNPVPTPTPTDGETVLFRVNAGGPEVAALDGGPNFLADTAGSNSEFLIEAGSNSAASFVNVAPGSTVEATIPAEIFQTERFDFLGGNELQYAFDVPEAGLYEVRLFVGNGFNGTDQIGERVFDVAIEGNVPSNLNDIDLINLFGDEVGGVLSSTVNVTDGTLNIEFLHGVENPLVNGIEIIQLDGSSSPSPSPAPVPTPAPTPAPTPTPTPTPIPPQTIRLEAEDGDIISGYRVEDVGVASGNQVLSLLAGGSTTEEGVVTFGFDETPGSYDIILGTFDETDGESQFVVELNDAETGITTEIGSLLLNESPGGGLASAQNQVARTVSLGVSLTAGDSITVRGSENIFEPARLDFIELISAE